MKKLMEIQNAICKAIREGKDMKDIIKKYNVKFVKPLKVTKKQIEEIGDKTFVFHYHNENGDNMCGFTFHSSQLEKFKELLSSLFVKDIHISLWNISQNLEWGDDDLVTVTYVIHSTMGDKEYFNEYDLTKIQPSSFYDIFIDEFPNDYQEFVDSLDNDTWLKFIKIHR